MELFKVALRNVFRNPRRTILNVIAIALGVMVILNLQAWIVGMEQTVYQTQRDIDTADVQILNKGYEAESIRLPLDLGIPDTQAVETFASRLPGIAAVGARIDYAAGLSNGVTSVPVQVRGVDPVKEPQLTNIARNLTAGTWLKGPNDIVVGSGLAATLGLKVGQQVFLTALDRYGVRNLVAGTISGIFSLGFALFDHHIIFTTLDKAREALSLPADFSTRVVLRFHGQDTAAETTETALALRQNTALAGQPLKVYEWKEFAQTVVSSIDSRIRIMTLMLSILVLLVIVGILNSLSMSVQERFREIGTLRALGMKRRNIRRLFLAEGLLLGALGGFIGVVAALLLGLAFMQGIDVTKLMPANIPIPFTSLLKPVYQPLPFVLAITGSAFIAVLGAWIPARRAGKLKIIDALGSHL